MVQLRSQVETAAMTDINITPFTDVLLVLLIIFMTLAALMAPPGFQRHLPCKCGHAASRTVQPLDVTVDANGAIRIDGRATDARRIYADLRRALDAHRTRNLSLDASAKAPYSAILRVLDAAKLAGDANVSLLTQ